MSIPCWNYVVYIFILLSYADGHHRTQQYFFVTRIVELVHRVPIKRKPDSSGSNLLFVEGEKEKKGVTSMGEYEDFD